MDLYLALSLESRTRDKIRNRDRSAFTSLVWVYCEAHSAKADEGPLAGPSFSSVGGCAWALRKREAETQMFVRGPVMTQVDGSKLRAVGS